MTIDVVGTPQTVLVTVPRGGAVVVASLALGIVTGIEDTLPTTISVVVTGAAPDETITFTIGSTDVAVMDADSEGNLGPIDIPVGDDVTTDFAVTATSATSGSATQVVVLPAGMSEVGGTADPGVDAPPVLVAESTARWVLQDLTPGGLGSWVMPINPKTMTNPHLTKTANARHTTALNTGRATIGETSPAVVAWTVAGYCPNQAYHDQLMAYAALNRRIYVIDHRGRAWKCAITALEITPRKRQTEEDGTPQDWAGDYRLVFDLLDQTFLIPA